MSSGICGTNLRGGRGHWDAGRPPLGAKKLDQDWGEEDGEEEEEDSQRVNPGVTWHFSSNADVQPIGGFPPQNQVLGLGSTTHQRVVMNYMCFVFGDPLPICRYPPLHGRFKQPQWHQSDLLP